MDAKKKRAVLQMAICAILWSTGGIFIKILPWNGFIITGFRSLIAALVLVVYLSATKQKFVVTKRTLLLGLDVAVVFFLFIVANKLTTAANVIVLQYTAPVFLLVFGVLFQKKKFRSMDYVAVALVTGGIALFFFDQLAPGTLLGNLLSVLAGAGFGAMFLVTEGMEENVRMSGILQGHLMAALVGVPMMFLFDTPFTAQTTWVILALGILQIGIPYMLFGMAVQHCSGLTCVLVSALEPLLNPVWVFLVTGELPGFWALIGVAIVMVTVTLWCVWDEKHKNVPKEHTV